MYYSELIERAVTLAALAHHGVYRNSPENVIPYLSVPASVGILLARAGYPEEVVAAGVLHDVLTKSETATPGDVQALGPAVYELVVKVCDPDMTASAKTRNERYYDNFINGDDNSRAVAMAHQIQMMRHEITSMNAGSDPYRRLKKGPSKRFERRERLIVFLEENGIEHRLKDDYRASLDESKKKAREAGYSL